MVNGYVDAPHIACASLFGCTRGGRASLFALGRRRTRSANGSLRGRARRRYRPWAELLKRTFSLDVLECDKCHGRLRLLAMVTGDKSIARFLRKLGEPFEPPPRLPARGPPYWKSRALRRMAGDIAVA